MVIFVWVGLSVSLAERSCDAVPASQRIGTPYWYAPLLDAVICRGDLHVYDFWFQFVISLAFKFLYKCFNQDWRCF